MTSINTVELTVQSRRAHVEKHRWDEMKAGQVDSSCILVTAPIDEVDALSVRAAPSPVIDSVTKDCFRFFPSELDQFGCPIELEEPTGIAGYRDDDVRGMSDITRPRTERR